MSSRLSSNLSYNVLGAVLPLFITLVTVPVYLRTIGAERYGILSLAWILLGYLGFLDFGLSRAATNALAKTSPPPSVERTNIIFTVLILNGAIGIVGALVVYGLASYFVEHVANLNPSLRNETIACVPWIVSLLPIGLISGIGSGALESRDRFFTANIIQIVGSSVVQVVPVIIAINVSPRLDVVVPAVAITRYMTALVALSVAFWNESRFRRASLNIANVRTLFSYGAWVGITNIVGPLLTSIDQMVIAAYLGTSAVTHYSVPMSLATRSQTLAAALSRTLFPRLSREQPAAAKALSERSNGTLTYIYTFFCAPALFLAYPFLFIWLGKGFADIAFPTAVILMVGAWINSLAFLPFALLQAQGRPDIPAKFHIIEFFPFIFLLLFFIKQFGLTGAALAWAIRCGVDTILHFIAVQYSKKELISLVGPTILICLAAFLSSILRGSIWVNLVLGAMFAVVAAGVGLRADTRIKDFVLSFVPHV